MEVDLWEGFRKKRNSTDIPTGGETARQVVKNMTLKQSSSILNPVLTMSGGELPTYNYAYIPTYRRYYYVENWTWENGVWAGSFAVDTLASWRNEIKNTEWYLVRSTSAINPDIADANYPTLATPVNAINRASKSMFGASLSEGTYIVGIVNGDAWSVGAVTYYGFKESEFKSLLTKLFDSTDWMGISTDEISNELLKTLVNPIRFITSAMFIPVPYSSICESTTKSSLKIGWWDISGITCRKVKSLVVSDNISIIAPPHPQAAGMPFLCNAPYTTRVLFVPGIGDIPIEAGRITNETTLDFKISLDITCGRILLEKLASDDDDVGGKYYGNIGTTLQLSQMSFDPSKAFSVPNLIMSTAQTLSSGGSLFDGNFLGNVFSGIESTIKNAGITYNSTGSNGSIVDTHLVPELRSTFLKVVETRPEIFGNPDCRLQKLDVYSGYAQAAQPNIQIPGLLPEIEEINNYMKEGVIIA